MSHSPATIKPRPAQHTPGPWQIIEYTAGYSIGKKQEKGEAVNSIAQLHCNYEVEGMGAAMQQANANLIVAAPELFEALSELRASILIHCNTTAQLAVKEQIQKAGAVLAKAKRA